MVAASILGACSGGPSLPDLNALSLASEPKPAPVAAPKWTMVALRPLVGMSPAFGQQVLRQVNDRATGRSIALMIDPDAKAELTLVGYFTTRPDKKTTVFDYTWDVVDANGGLVNRVSGSETAIQPKKGGDPWSALSPQATANIADKALDALAADTAKSSVSTASITRTETSPTP